MSTTVGSLDIGTQSVRFIEFDTDGKIVTQMQLDCPLIHPKPGWAEHDPMQSLSLIEQCLAGSGSVKAVGITNHRESVFVWDRTTGQPLYNAILWLDTRTDDLVAELEKKHGRDGLRGITGLPFSTYFSGVKIRWLLDNVEAVRQACDDGVCCFGTADTWALWNVTGGVDGGVFATDVTNASRTMLMDLATCQWSDEACRLFDIPKASLPSIRSSSEVYGTIISTGTPIAGVLGDQQSALVGHACFGEGMAKNTYGTGCFLLVNTGKDKPVQSTNGLLTTVAYKLGDDVVYALEGSVASAGIAVTWLVDNLGIADSPQHCDELAESVDQSGGVVFVPAFSGLLAPRWRSDARGIVTGLTHHTTRAHICRALLESIAFQTREVFNAAVEDVRISGKGGWELQSLRVDGGVTKSRFTMQTQADILGIEVQRPAMREVTALGAAFAAGLAVGVWPDMASLPVVQYDAVFNPAVGEEEMKRRIDMWNKGVDKALH